MLAVLCSPFVLQLSAQNDTDPALGTFRENQGPSINTAAIEILPIVSPDGKTLYFDRKYDSANTNGVNDPDDIWFSTLGDDGQWTPAQNIGPPLNTPGSDVLYWISADARSALIYSDALAARGLGLGIAQMVDGRWQAPEPIVVDGLSTLGDYYYGFISSDQRRLLLAYAADSSDPENLDIYVSTRSGAGLLHWGSPKWLGRTVNTAKFDGAPFLAPDNRTLYFTSDGYNGIGGMDLYVTRRLDDTWLNWSEPVNLGLGINTPRSEASLSIAAEGDRIYVSGGSFGGATYGKSDVFRLALPEEHQPDPTVMVSGMLTTTSGGVQGLVRAERIEAAQEEVASTSSDSHGAFTFILPADVEYRLTGWAPGYEEVELKITPRAEQPRMSVTLSLDGGESQKNQAPESPDQGNNLQPIPGDVMGEIYFDTGSSHIHRLEAEKLSRLLSAYHALVDAAQHRINLVGHADAVGKARDNMRLSRQRAESVSRWLVEHGVEQRLIVAEARGESEPIASNETNEGRARNRRVAVRVKK
jgi:outer membrane protein OmpA-like peptidoglycan-associated protein